MALSGIFYGTSSNPRIKPQISWSAVQSVAGNYSDVTAKLQYTRSNSGYTTGGTWKGTLTIGGDTVTKSLYMEITYGNTTTVITHKVRVYHGDNGKKSITISGTGGIVTPADASLKTTDISETVTLDTIPRASTISATDCNIGSCSTVVVGKKDGSFTHSIGYAFGSLSGFLTANGECTSAEEKFSQTVVNFALPEHFYAQIPNSPTGVCTLTCNTYQGQTKIGSKTTSFTVTASESLCKPEISLAVMDVNPVTEALTGNAQVLVLNASTARCFLSAEGKQSAQIDQMTLLGQVTAGQTDLLLVATGNLTYSATDTRGYRTEQTYTAQVVPYVMPTVNVSVKRDSPTADTAVLTVTGQCFHGSFGQTDNTFLLEISVAEQPTIQVQVPLQTDNRYQVQVPLTGLSYQHSHLVQVTGTDKLNRVEKTVSLSAGVPVFDWGAADFQFHVPVYANAGLWQKGVSLLDWVYPVGSVYISFNHTNPATRLGGTWERILGQNDSDVFLCGCKAGDTLGSYGGSANGLADQIAVAGNQVGGLHSDATEGSYKARVLITRNSNYTNTYEDGTQLLSAVGTGTNYQNKNLPPFVKVSMWRRTA